MPTTTDSKGYDWGGFLTTDPLSGQPPFSPTPFGKLLFSEQDAASARDLLGILGLGGGTLPSAALRGIAKHVWISNRLDGQDGTGAVEDPYNAGTNAAMFDAIMADAAKTPAGAVIHLDAPGGVILTKGFVCRSGWSIYVTEGTTIRLDVITPADVTALFGSSSHILAILGKTTNTLVEDVLVDGGIWDLNMQNQTQTLCPSAIQLVVDGFVFRNMKVINYGTTTTAEEFVVGAFSVGSRDGRIHSKGGIYDNIEFRDPATGVVNIGTISLINANGGQNVTDHVNLSNGWFENITVRNCFFNWSASNANNVGIDCINLGGWVKGFHSHHNRFKNISGNNARYGHYLDTGSAQDVLIEHNVYDSVAAPIYLVATASDQVFNNILVQNEQQNATYIGTFIFCEGSVGSTRVSVKNNKILGPSDAGVVVRNISNYYVGDNIINGPSLDVVTTNSTGTRFNNRHANGTACTGENLPATIGGTVSFDTLAVATPSPDSSVLVQFGTASAAVPASDTWIGGHTGGLTEITRLRTGSFDDNPAYGFYLKTNYTLAAHRPGYGAFAKLGTRDSGTDYDALTLRGGAIFSSNSNSVITAGLLATQTLATPGTVGISTSGTAGSTTYSYKITAVLTDGVTETDASTVATIATGNATLDGTNKINLSWTLISNAGFYNIYRTASGGTPSSTGKIGQTDGNSSTFSDTGLAGDSSTAPDFNSTGRLTSGQLSGTGIRPVSVAANGALVTTSRTTVTEAVTLTLVLGSDQDSTAGGTLTTVAFSGTPNYSLPPTVLRLLVTGGPYTLTIPTSYRIGETTSTTSVTLQNGYNELSWVYADSKYWLADTGNIPSGVTPGSYTNANITVNADGIITLAANGSSGGGAVAADVIWDAKGDLAVGTGANTAEKLTVGANNKVLVADSTQTTGTRWDYSPNALNLWDGANAHALITADDNELTFNSFTTATFNGSTAAAMRTGLGLGSAALAATGDFDAAGAAAGVVSDTAYDATSWNGVTGVAPSKNAVRNKIEALAFAPIATTLPTYVIYIATDVVLTTVSVAETVGSVVLPSGKYSVAISLLVDGDDETDLSINASSTPTAVVDLAITDAGPQPLSVFLGEPGSYPTYGGPHILLDAIINNSATQTVNLRAKFTGTGGTVKAGTTVIFTKVA